MGLKKIISGGQTGADIAGIDAAIEHGLSYGGWLPKGRKTEKGALDLKYTNMTEMPVGDYQEMTEENVKDSDGTVIFTHGKYSGVSALTMNYAAKHNKPFLHLDLDVASESTAIESLIEWIYKQKIETLNVAGSRESKDENIYDDVHSIIMSIINTIRTAEIIQKPQPPPAILPSFQETVFARPQVITEEAATGREEIEDSTTSGVSGLASFIERLPKIVRKNLVSISLAILLLTTAIFFLPGVLKYYSSESTPTKSLPLPEGRDSKTTGLSGESIPTAGITPEPSPQNVSALPTTTNPGEQPGIQPLPSHPKTSGDSQAELSKTNTDMKTDNPSKEADQPEQTEIKPKDAPNKTDPLIGALNTPIESLSDTSGETEKTETIQATPKKGPSKSQYRCESLYKKISLGKVLDKAETDFLTHTCN
jgi:hypothetical protein